MNAFWFHYYKIINTKRKDFKEKIIAENVREARKLFNEKLKDQLSEITILKIVSIGGMKVKS